MYKVKDNTAKNPVYRDKKEPILIKGARAHNLQNIDVELPRGKFIVVTGVSGSGKSSLTIDTLFAEGQRRYAESLSAYARQFLNRMNKPDVDYIKGLCPAIAIEQKVAARTPRSTVGTMTEIYDYLRLFFARVGKTYSPVSGQQVKKQEIQDVVQKVAEINEGARILLLSELNLSGKRNVTEELSLLLQKGFNRIYILTKNKKQKDNTNESLLIEELLEDKTHVKKLSAADQVFIIIDRFVAKKWEEDDLHRLSDSVSIAFEEGSGELWLNVDGDFSNYSRRFELDGIRFEEPSPNLFAFNNSYGACPTCEGYSQVLGIDENLVIPDRSLSVYDGAVAPWKGEKLGWWREQFIKSASKEKFPIHKPVSDLTQQQYRQLWEGVGAAYGIHHFFKEVEANLYKVQYRVMLSRYRGRTTCPDCNGSRLRKEALYVKIGGEHIGTLSTMPVKQLSVWLDVLEISNYDRELSARILIELRQRINTLLAVGLGYLTLHRNANTLSGGESQRIQLTRMLGSNLTDSLYILDEPSIGLHPRDTAQLISVLKSLRDLGNTVIVVEHDEMMMREADHILDMGPFAGYLGGKLIAQGNLETIMQEKNSLTAQYLSGQKQIPVQPVVRSWTKSIMIEGAQQHNLKNIDVCFPLNVLCVVCGVSGSGKTTLVKQILYPALKKIKKDPDGQPGLFKNLNGDLDTFTQVEMVDQNPIGKSSRSNPVTYVKAYDEIRNLFADQMLSKIRGYKPGFFSFNVDGGRCDACKGEGEQIVEMQFLADVHLTCEVCHGKRFKEEVLEVQYNGKNIHEVLELSIDEALDFFRTEKELVNKLTPLQAVGLGYVKLGQSSDTLSGGEAQRVKLASFLVRGSGQGKILFIFDEPTTGLHFHDIAKLLNSFHALIEKGHSVIVVEHNTDVIKRADWIIELGPEAGDGGGNLVFEGRPTGIYTSKESRIKAYL
jgi:excinuclease ABC subunit A